jgi:DNA polymerase V
MDCRHVNGSRTSISSGRAFEFEFGDELIVNRALEPKDGSVVIAVLDGELTVKRLRITPTGVVLQAENPRYPDILVPGLSELTIWGVATRCLHDV